MRVVIFDHLRWNLIALLLAIVAGFCARPTSAGAINNRILDTPIVSCENEMVMLSFITERPFNGRVYVKGMLDLPECSANFVNNVEKQQFSMMISKGDCGMKQNREPHGQITYSVVFVVSHHGTFVTKADRAYRCVCQHREFKKVSESINLAMLTTVLLTDDIMPFMPDCSYSIHADTREGPVIHFAGIGDKIFHVWKCRAPGYGFLVHSCYVEDGRGERFDLIDEQGCAIDPVIQPEILYDHALSHAHTETHGYKFSGTSVLQYRCLLEFCRMEGNECAGAIPPQCGRGKRSVRSMSHDKSHHLSTSVDTEVQVIDTLTEDAADSSRNFLLRINQPYSNSLSSPDYCLAIHGALFALLMDMLFLFIVTLVVLKGLSNRKRNLYIE